MSQPAVPAEGSATAGHWACMSCHPALEKWEKAAKPVQSETVARLSPSLHPEQRTPFMQLAASLNMSSSVLELIFEPSPLGSRVKSQPAAWKYEMAQPRSKE